MNTFSRLVGVILNPQQIFKFLSEKPVWADVLIAIIIVTIIFSYITAPFLQKDQIKAFESNVKFQERLGEERFNEYMDNLKNPSKTQVMIRSFLINPILLLVGFVISTLIILFFGRLTSPEGKFMQIFSAYLHAQVIDKVLGAVIKLFLALSRESVLQTTTSLAAFFPKLEITSPAFIVLSQIDLFQLWAFGVFSYGVAYIFKIHIKKALFISYGFWAVKSILYIGLALVSMRLLGG